MEPLPFTSTSSKAFQDLSLPLLYIKLYCFYFCSRYTYIFPFYYYHCYYYSSGLCFCFYSAAVNGTMRPCKKKTRPIIKLMVSEIRPIDKFRLLPSVVETLVHNAMEKSLKCNRLFVRNDKCYIHNRPNRICNFFDQNINLYFFFVSGECQRYIDYIFKM